MKKIFALTIAAVLLISAAAIAQAPLTAWAEYEGWGHVEIELSRDVRWENIEVSVTDEAGLPVEVRLIKADEDDIDFKIPDIEEDKTYTVTVSGIAGGESVSCELIAPSAKSTLIEEVDYDADDRELEIEFSGRVIFNDPTVTVTDENGAQYKTWITEKDDDSIELLVDGLILGNSYTVTVSGAAIADSGVFETYARDFVAFDD